MRGLRGEKVESVTQKQKKTAYEQDHGEVLSKSKGEK